MPLFKKKPTAPGPGEKPPGLQGMDEQPPSIEYGKMPSSASPPSGPFAQKPGLEEHPFPPPLPPAEQESIKQQVGYPDQPPAQSYQPPKYIEPPKGQAMKEPFEDQYSHAEAEASAPPVPPAIPPPTPPPEEEFYFEAEKPQLEEEYSYPTQQPGLEPAPEPFKGEDEPSRGSPEFGESPTGLPGGMEHEKLEEQEKYKEEEEYKEHPPALIPPPPSASSQSLAQSAAEGVKQEIQTELKSLKEDVSELKEIDDQMVEMVDVLKNIESKYRSIEKKVGQLPPEKERELTEMKESIDNLNSLVSKALPALIQKVKEISDAVGIKK